MQSAMTLQASDYLPLNAVKIQHVKSARVVASDNSTCCDWPLRIDADSS